MMAVKNKTLKDISELTGYSISTVSRALNNEGKKYRISEKAIKKINLAAQKMNYKRNDVARSLRLRKSHTIGLIVPDISNPFFSYLTKIIQLSCSSMGYSLIVCNTNEDIRVERSQMELLQTKGVDGFIVMPVGSDHDHFDDYNEDGVPFVLLDRTFRSNSYYSVSVDNFQGAYQAVKFMILNNHRRIAIIKGASHASTVQDRLDGYKEALKEAGIPVDEQLITGNSFSTETGYKETKFLLNLPDPPTAIFATSDLITLGTLEALAEENMSIPEDISLVSYDDVEFAHFNGTPLTAVHQPKRLMAEMVVKLLVDIISDRIDKSGKNGSSKNMILQPSLIVRKSVSPLN